VPATLPGVAQHDASLPHPPPPRRTWTARQTLDVVAVALILAGTGILVATAFAWHHLAGWAAVGLAVTGIGTVVGAER
jgi:hypothetical protein